MKSSPLEINVPVDVDLFMTLYQCAQRSKHRFTIRDILAQAIRDYAETLDQSPQESVDAISESESQTRMDEDLLGDVGAILVAVDKLKGEILATGTPLGRAVEQALAHWLDAVSRLTALDIPLSIQNTAQLTSVVRNPEYLTEDDESGENPEASSNGRKAVQIILVRLPNGDEICDRYAANTFMSVVKMAGLDRVSSLDMTLSGHPILAKEPHPNSVYRSVEIESGWYLTVPPSTDQKIDLLERINAAFSLGLKIDAVERSVAHAATEEFADMGSGDANRKSWPSTVQVLLPDGTLFDDRIAFRNLERLVKHIGLEKVASLNIGTSQYPLLIRTARDRYKEIGDGWFLYANTSTELKYNHITQIGERLGLGIVSEIVERPKL